MAVFSWLSFSAIAELLLSTIHENENLLLGFAVFRNGSSIEM